MNIEHLKSNLQKRSIDKGIIYHLGQPTSEKTIKRCEEVIGQELPGQIKLFYQNYNGLKIKRPALEIYSMEKLFKKDHLLLFSKINEIHKLYFDTEFLNQAGQWNIVSESCHIITMTFASFWSNKIWAWIDSRRAIWSSEPYNV